MNKKKILGCIAIFAIISIATFNVNLGAKHTDLPGMSLTNNEALAQEADPGVVIYCKCTRNIFSKNCKANGDDGVCAQSSQGGNINCSQYNSNC
jgi:hypothetical protein